MQNMNISQATYDHYWDKGWVVVEGVYRTDEVDRTAKLALEISDEEIQKDTSSFDADRSADGTVIAPRKIGEPFLKASTFQSFVLDPRLTRIIADLIGEKPLLFGD
jgi:hypothetical protein